MMKKEGEEIMQTTYIETFKAGDRIVGFYIIKILNLRTSSNNKTFLDLILIDKTGEFNARIGYR